MTKAKRLLNNKDTIKTEILMTPVRDLGLKIKGSILETCINKALADAKSFGVEIEPTFYLSDSYGCIEGTTTVGLGFWDADKIIREILRETKDVFRDENELLRLIKHEMGHAFCYAYKLYRLKEFRELFKVEGHFFQTYPENNRYMPDPWSANYVNPEGDFYAQKHPDDDFAETFATFINPDEDWRKRYEPREGAFRKIQFVRKVIKNYGRQKPLTNGNGKMLHMPVEEIKQTVGEFFKISPRRYILNADGYIDPDLKAIFRSPGRIKKPVLPGYQLVTRYRLFIEKTVKIQSKIQDQAIIKELLTKTISRLKTLKLVYIKEEEEKTLAMLTCFILLKTVSFKLFNTFRLPKR